MPHYAYARSDKKEAPRISIGGRSPICLPISDLSGEFRPGR
jgi:hypothetical protein